MTQTQSALINRHLKKMKKAMPDYEFIILATNIRDSTMDTKATVDYVEVVNAAKEILRRTPKEFNN